MTENKNDIALGKFLSLILRHNPSAAGINLDSNGFADVSKLIDGINKTGRKIDVQTLERIVLENEKQRYSFNDEHTKIRANQGHSLPVELNLKPVQPPDILYHGTALRFLKQIQVEGITKQSRQQVHLSEDIETALKVGKRHGSPVILPINTAAMATENHLFYRSENGVWLCDSVPWRYIIKNMIQYPKV